MSEQIKDLKKKLFYDNKNGALGADKAVLDAANEYCKGYMAYLDAAKTERLATNEAIRLAKEQGFEEFDCNKVYPAGSKVYLNNHKKSAIFAVIGTEPVANGVNIIASHIDSPRLDLKPNPLYEKNDIAYFKTHYYGGIKKYQWTTIPLTLSGVVVKKSGEVVEVNIGDDANDPCFVITDLLPHLAQEQSKRTLDDGIRAEELNVMLGSYPFKSDDESELVKLNVVNVLFEKYGIDENDFLSAELEIVPSFNARDIGFDRSLIGAYGHDDRVCAYPSLSAIFDAKSPARTAIAVLADKEEIGSEGNTGLNSQFLAHFVEDLAQMQGTLGYRVLRNSKCLSADVNAAFDPTFPEVHEPLNASYINHGVVITKYTGHRGKGGSNDASAEYMAEIRALLDGNNVCWQTGELGRVDLGGGGTVAKYIADLGVTVVDLGVPVLSMHAPFEVVSKYDVYMTYLACKAFFN
ncbi:MAG: aminopeptidase [Clostridia bacterium]|nr:aminopeptidase [Clostridia bacterium]